MSSHELRKTKDQWLQEQQDEWLQGLKTNWVDQQFGFQAQEAFGGFPSLELLKVLWDTEWGQGVRDHFSIEYLQVPTALRALTAAYLAGGEEYKQKNKTELKF